MVSRHIFNFQFSIFNFLICGLLIGLTGCSNQKTSEAEIKFQQYFVQGELLYIKHCSNCHQSSGTGLGLVYPPVNQSDFMDTHLEEVLCLMKYGREGELMVNGKSFNQPMPGVAALTDIEIAEIATYIYNSWEHKKGLIEVSTVSGVMRNCSGAR
jgi:cytochrome c551